MFKKLSQDGCSRFVVLPRVPSCPGAVSPIAVALKKMGLYLMGLILYYNLATLDQTYKELRCLFPISLWGAESGLESHPYGMEQIYYFRFYFATMLLLMVKQFFIPTIARFSNRRDLIKC